MNSLSDFARPVPDQFRGTVTAASVALVLIVVAAIGFLFDTIVDVATPRWEGDVLRKMLKSDKKWLRNLILTKSDLLKSDDSIICNYQPNPGIVEFLRTLRFWKKDNAGVLSTFKDKNEFDVAVRNFENAMIALLYSKENADAVQFLSDQLHVLKFRRMAASMLGIFGLEIFIIHVPEGLRSVGIISADRSGFIKRSVDVFSDVLGWEFVAMGTMLAISVWIVVSGYKRFCYRVLPLVYTVVFAKEEGKKEGGDGKASKRVG